MDYWETSISLPVSKLLCVMYEWSIQWWTKGREYNTITSVFCELSTGKHVKQVRFSKAMCSRKNNSQISIVSSLRETLVSSLMLSWTEGQVLWAELRRTNGTFPFPSSFRSSLQTRDVINLPHFQFRCQSQVMPAPDIIKRANEGIQVIQVVRWSWHHYES